MRVQVPLLALFCFGTPPLSIVAAVIWVAEPVLPASLVFVAATVVPWTVA
ncbi:MULTISPECIES: hypothetical protein [unclassified Curtobacterium]|nr:MULTISPECIES: hypothetical protein [unclassified Curtobacterium]